MTALYALGVDLGTVYTAAATWRDGHAEIVSLGSRSATIPSVVLLREDASFLTGEAANRRALMEPSRVAREFKRRFGDATPIMLGGTPHSPEALMGRLLHSVVSEVTAQQGEAPVALCVCHPANWGPYKTDLLQQSIRMADLNLPVTLAVEPVAAAAYYARQQRVDDGALVAVYDLGGGTFDAAVVRKAGDSFEIVGRPEGIEHLGGADFDAAVFEHVRSVVGEALSGLDDSLSATVAAVSRLREECTSAKETLSSDTDTTIPVLLPSYATEVRITRAELERMVRPSLYDTISALQRAIRSAGVTSPNLHSVLLIGGSSRMPLVAQLVGAEVDRPVAVDAHPKHAVALGAAWIARAHQLAQDPSSAQKIADQSAPPDRTAPPTPVTGLGTAAAAAGAAGAAGAAVSAAASAAPGPGRGADAPASAGPSGLKAPANGIGPPSVATRASEAGTGTGWSTLGDPPPARGAFDADGTGAGATDRSGTATMPAAGPGSGRASWPPPQPFVPGAATPPPGAVRPGGLAAGAVTFGTATFGANPPPGAVASSGPPLGAQQPGQAPGAAPPPGAAGSGAPPGGWQSTPAPSFAVGPPARASVWSRPWVLAVAAALAVVVVVTPTAWYLGQRLGRSSSTGTPSATASRVGTPAATSSTANGASVAATSAKPGIYTCPTNADAAVWGCLKSARASGGNLYITYTTNFTLSGVQDAAHYHFHLYLADPGPNGTTDPADSIMQEVPNPGSWYIIYDGKITTIDNNSIRGGKKAPLDVSRYSLFCVRVASGLHGLVPDKKGGLHTGNCVKITT